MLPVGAIHELPLQGHFIRKLGLKPRRSTTAFIGF
jgi:hypothetical protein